jgi:hypothetical protein
MVGLRNGLVVLLISCVLATSQQTIQLDSDVTTAVLSPRNDILLTVQQQSTVLTVWRYNVSTNVYQGLQNITGNNLTAAAVSPCSDALFLVTSNGTILVYNSCINSTQFSLVKVLLSDAACTNRSISRLAINQDLTQMVTTCAKNVAVLWNVNITAGTYSRWPVNQFAVPVESMLVGSINSISVITSNNLVTFLNKTNGKFSIAAVQALDGNLALNNSIDKEIVIKQLTKPDIILKTNDNSLNQSNLQLVAGTDGRCNNPGSSQRSVACPTNNSAAGLSKGGIIALAVAVPLGVLTLAGVGAGIGVAVSKSAAAANAGTSSAAQAAFQNNPLTNQHIQNPQGHQPSHPNQPSHP